MTTPPVVTPVHRYSLARIVLRGAMVLLGAIALVGAVFFAGGLGGHDVAWMLAGLAIMGATRFTFVVLNRAITKLVGQSVAYWDC